MSMILPERTVDVWTATYVTGRRWRARLWAPTEQRPDEAYDLAVGFGSMNGLFEDDPGEPWPDKVFVLEHKGCAEDARGPYVTLRLKQLARNVWTDAQAGGKLVYYLLPEVPWTGRQPAPAGTIPPNAALRTRSAISPGFQSWAWVVSASRLDSWLRREVRLGNLAWYTVRGKRPDAHLRLPCYALPSIPSVLNLRDFISAVRDCWEGLSPRDLSKGLNPTGPLPTNSGDWLGWNPPGLEDLSEDNGDEAAAQDEGPHGNWSPIPAGREAVRRAAISWKSLYGVGFDPKWSDEIGLRG